MATSEERIAAAKARSAAAAAKRAPTPEQLAEREAVRAEREADAEEALTSAVCEHGEEKVAAIDTDLGRVIVKRAHPANYKKFQDLGNAKTRDFETLVRGCLVFPTLERFEAMMAEQPAILMRCADAVVTLAGVRRDESAGKF